MKLLSKLGLPTLALVALTGTALAGIHEKASSTSHQLDNAAVALDDYMHDNYSTSYGAHDPNELVSTARTLKLPGGRLRSLDPNGTHVAWLWSRVRDQFTANGIFADQDAKKIYDDCHRLTVLVTAYTNSAN